MSDPITVLSEFFTALRVGDAVVIKMTRTRLTEDDNLEQFTHDLHALIEKDEARRLVLDCTELEYMTSSAIGRLISLHRRLGREQGSLVLCGLTSGVRDVLDTARLLSYFRSAADVRGALAAMTAPQLA